jgi:2-polyprenyl-6-hydroxyphenyl methylase/3-demethylubiquinone-9 3-methyltransferase
MLFVSTIDRTCKSFVVAIIGAEYLLRVLPRGIHQWSMFVRSQELSSALAPSDLQIQYLCGMRYVPLVHKASWCKDTQVNCITTFTHSAHHNHHP